MTIKGYLIQNHEDRYLSHDWVWCQHDNFQDAFVHPKKDLEEMLDRYNDFHTKFSKITKAEYNKEKHKTKLMQEPIGVYELSVDQIRELLQLKK